MSEANQKEYIPLVISIIMGKYDRHDSTNDMYSPFWLKKIANELAETNRLKRLEMSMNDKYTDMKTWEFGKLEDKA
jgi:hypothetical protein